MTLLNVLRTLATLFLVCSVLLTIVAAKTTTKKIENKAHVDRCKQDKKLCGDHTTCVNTERSYKCICKQGFTKAAGSYKRCVDIDECKKTDCGQNAWCSNSPGSYQCNCKYGYHYNARFCQVGIMYHWKSNLKTCAWSPSCEDSVYSSSGVAEENCKKLCAHQRDCVMARYLKETSKCSFCTDTRIYTVSKPCSVSSTYNYFTKVVTDRTFIPGQPTAIDAKSPKSGTVSPNTQHSKVSEKEKGKGKHVPSVPAKNSVERSGKHVPSVPAKKHSLGKSHPTRKLSRNSGPGTYTFQSHYHVMTLICFMIAYGFC